MMSLRKTLCSSCFKNVTFISKRRMNIRSKFPIESMKKNQNFSEAQRPLIDKVALLLSGDSAKSSLFFAALISMPLACMVGNVALKKQIAQIVAHRFKQDSDETHSLENLGPIIEQVLKDAKRTSIKDITDLNIFFTDHLSVYPLLLGSSVDTTVGGAIGVPFYSTFHSKTDVKLEELKHKSISLPYENLNVLVDLEKVKIPSDQMEKLKETFTLSDKAKKFMIASYLSESQSKIVSAIKMGKYAIALGLIGLMQNAMTSFAKKRGLPSPVFVGLSMMTFGFGGIVSILVASNCRHALDASCDFYACNLGTEYIEGGVEFYSKAIQRIQYLRELSSEAANVFTEESDLNAPNDLQDVPIVSSLKERLEFCQNFTAEKVSEAPLVSLIKS